MQDGFSCKGVGFFNHHGMAARLKLFLFIPVFLDTYTLQQCDWCLKIHAE